MGAKAAFFDRDGVINVDGAYVYRVKDFVLIDGIMKAAKKLYDAGYLLIIVTNQSGIGQGFYSDTDYEILKAHILDLFKKNKSPLAAIYHCPHHPTKGIGRYKTVCKCRKPEPGMYLRAKSDFDIDMSQSVAFGDKERDLIAAEKAGVRHRIFVGTDGKSTPMMVDVATGVARTVEDALIRKVF